MEKITIKRDGRKPITFTGEMIGKASSHSHQGDKQNRWTEVEIYLTRGGNYVALLVRRTCWQGESDRLDAEVCLTPADVIAFLSEGEPELGTVSQEAVEKAAKNDEAFAKAWIEEVE